MSIRGHLRRHGTALVLGCATAQAAAADAVAAFHVQGDAIAQPLVATAGDPARGREIVMGREGNCLLCHAIPETGAPFMGNVAPSLSGVASRLSAGQMRLRVVDASRLNPETIMPPYHRIDGLRQVATAWQGKPILTAQQVEDTVAYLLTLQR